jgi:diaminohydroxyphosphoribosylaminopyrimidine deaminase/5-amino-6-(5-phosphoribosylamino)uracil reductase
VVDDVKWMQRALTHARRGLGRTTPNPVVGACIVTPEGVVVGDGAHERAGGPHAEVHALTEAGDRARGATLYCTLEPCVHTGRRRTGPCTDQIIAAGIRRVVAAIEDPYPRVQGRGFATLRAHGIEVTIGVEREAAEILNCAYLMCVRQGRPWVILKAAISADGYVSAAPGVRTTLTSDQARRHAQVVRAQVDAIGIGSGTLLVDDPRLTVRDVYRPRPLMRVVFDRRLRTPASARLFESGESGPVIIVTSERAAAASRDRVRALEDAGARLLPLASTTVLDGLRALAALDVQSVLLEGGPVFHRAALDEGLVDQVQLYVAPRVLGDTGVSWLPGGVMPELKMLTATALGHDVFLEGYVHRPH